MFAASDPGGYRLTLNNDLGRVCRDPEFANLRCGTTTEIGDQLNPAKGVRFGSIAAVRFATAIGGDFN